MFKTYYSLTKPGIIRGNVITAAAGFFLASRGHVNFWLLGATLAGLSLVIASACVFNNYIDRDIDAKMSRTKQRALVRGQISNRHALIFARLLGVLGALILALYTNLLTFALAVTGFVFYVFVYGIWKRKSVHGTLVGSISGAIPPVVGYTAVTGHLDPAALILFLILVVWQMPHFYAIAIYRQPDYEAAGIPVMPIKQGIRRTKITMLVYTLAFIPVAASLTIFGYTGLMYLAIVLVLGLVWLVTCLRGLSTTNDQRWAQQMFKFSLIVLTALSVTIPLQFLAFN